MIKRFVSYVGSKPKNGAVIILTLAVAFLLVLAGLALDLSHYGRAPYPSQELGFSLINGNVLFTQDTPTQLGNFSSPNTTVPSTPYEGALGAFGIVEYGWSTFNFGNAPQLSAHTGAPSTMNLTSGGSPISVNLTLTDLTSNGVFDKGDTILFKVVPLQKDTVYFVALAFFPGGGWGPWSTEMSFAIHDGKVYSWFSNNLPAQKPWFDLSQ